VRRGIPAEKKKLHQLGAVGVRGNFNNRTLSKGTDQPFRWKLRTGPSPLKGKKERKTGWGTSVGTQVNSGYRRGSEKKILTNRESRGSPSALKTRLSGLFPETLIVSEGKKVIQVLAHGKVRKDQGENQVIGNGRMENNGTPT